MLTTTFKLLRKHGACKDRYRVLRKSLKGRKDNEQITLLEILDSNGVADAIWALRAVPEEQSAERDRLARLYACWCVRQVPHLLTDERSRYAVEVSERYAAAAYAAARDAAYAEAAAANAYAYAYAADGYAADGYAAARDAQAAKFRKMFG